MVIERVEITADFLARLARNVDKGQQHCVEDWIHLVSHPNQRAGPHYGWAILEDKTSEDKTSDDKTSDDKTSEDAHLTPLGCALVHRSPSHLHPVRNVVMNVACSAEDLIELLERSIGDIDAMNLLPGAAEGIETWFRGLLETVVAKHVQDLRWTATRSIALMQWPSANLRPLVPIPEAVGNQHDSLDPHFKIASLDPGDEAELALVNNAAFEDHLDRANWTAQTVHDELSSTETQHRDVLVARVNHPSGQMCGYAWTRIYDKQENIGEVWALGVSPSFGGKGIGKALLRTAMHHLIRRRHMSRLVLYVDTDNAAAIKLYRDHDFQDSGQRLSAYRIKSQKQAD